MVKKLSKAYSVDFETADFIKHISKELDISESAAVCFIIKKCIKNEFNMIELFSKNFSNGEVKNGSTN